MSISIQLVEVPENEQVAVRQMSLPDSGGTIGRSYDCNIQLPDFNRQLSRVHVEVSPDAKGGYQVTDRSTNGVYLNGTYLGKGRHLPISDGDVIKLGDYVLLISDMNSLFAEPVVEELEPEFRKEPTFSIDSFNDDDLGWPMDAENVATKAEPVSTAFSARNVMADDVMGYDPFDDDLEMQPSGASEHSADVFTVDHAPSGDAQQLVKDSLVQLNKMMAQQQQMQTEPYSHDKLIDCLHRTLDKFLEELNPTYMEDVFSDYVSGWGSKEKKYWRLYRKEFNRKLDRKEFHRQFTALFVEEMRGKN